MFVVHITQLISVDKKAKLAMKERRVPNGTWIAEEDVKKNTPGGWAGRHLIQEAERPHQWGGKGP